MEYICMHFSYLRIHSSKGAYVYTFVRNKKVDKGIQNKKRSHIYVFLRRQFVLVRGFPDRIPTHICFVLKTKNPTRNSTGTEQEPNAFYPVTKTKKRSKPTTEILTNGFRVHKTELSNKTRLSLKFMITVRVNKIR